MSKARPPLDGIRVLDFSRVMAGPYLTMVLADLGADVIKVENPKGGDDTRSFKPPELAGESAYFLSVNRLKRSLSLNIQTPEGQRIARELAAKCDVLVQNFRADVMGRQGLDYESLKAINPRLIYASISGYGQTGPYRLVAGYDQIAQGEAGMQYLTGGPDDGPVRAGCSIGDTLTGLHCGMAILAALHARERTGEGQEVDLALFDTVFATTSYLTQGAMITGKDPLRTGNSSGLVVPTGLFACQDGKINLLIGNDRIWLRFCEAVIERPDLANDPRFRTNADRQINREACEALVAEALAGGTRDQWIARARENGVPAGSVRGPVEAAASPEAAARNMVKRVEHRGIGAFDTVASPINLSGTPVREPGAAPTLGQHTNQVLGEMLGMDEAGIDALRKAGAIG